MNEKEIQEIAFRVARPLNQKLRPSFLSTPFELWWFCLGIAIALGYVYKPMDFYEWHDAWKMLLFFLVYGGFHLWWYRADLKTYTVHGDVWIDTVELVKKEIQRAFDDGYQEGAASAAEAAYQRGYNEGLKEMDEYGG